MTDLAAPLMDTIALGTETILPEKGALSAGFNKASDFIHGELEQESQDAVQKLHERFTQRIQATVDAALPGCQDEELKKAAVAYCIALSRTRKETTPKQLAEKCAKGAEALKEETKTMLASLTELEESLAKELKQRREQPLQIEPQVNPSFNFFTRVLTGFQALFGRAAAPAPQPDPASGTTVTVANDDAPSPAPAPASARPSSPEDIKSFLDGQVNRLYFRLNDASKSPVQPFVEHFLESQGYTVTDYAEGYATDKRKNKLKIGKLLKDNAGLYEAYKEDSSRMSKNLMVVITRSFEDLARASYGRGWQSCRANAWSAVSYAVKEVNVGVMSAYLIREDDPDIHNPLGRVNLKPYDTAPKDGGDYWSRPKPTAEERRNMKTVYFTFNPIGLHHPGFVDAVNRFADAQFNADKYGKFRLRDDCESFREMQTRSRLPEDAEGALKAIGADYKKDNNGRITVNGDLNLSGLGLSRLPDLRDVTVTGGINVSNNKLLTLEGLPTAPVKFLDASSNLLVCFAGATPEVTGEFNYKDCCYLMTTLGAPKAGSYSFGNGYRDSGNYMTSEKCVGPVEEPKRFPGFKRKD